MKHIYKTLTLAVVILGIMNLFTLEAQSTGTKTANTKVLVVTNKGKITLELFNETPLHRDNFLMLVRSGAYNGVHFHRIVPGFVIQGGNLMTKNARKGMDMHQDTLTRTVPAEFMPEKYFHERGALCAARESDDTNPSKASSGSQFYIVTGRYYTEYDLQKMSMDYGKTFTDAQKEAYKLQGGTPSLDGSYTVFGRVIDGMDTVMKIEKCETDGKDQPVKPVIIKSMSIIP
ncbi:Putative peptidyl-prolyl cis-trans isomerase [Porphyromonas macacae]|uniref:Peptidyl-prolyl cis-trans isomerase n=1 Tax=Porphyromonas macacae TaxID=28115 RepID=A0A379DGH4_9PORP|nr:peptidylprolyl isomerase [Porphyromonas macacae]SUB77510.1 Putative peptidyl-prolyl cis-trans isomerase [Porphyromonas macacae]SUB88652.1 Putative peptidyl-prolyl cis-trans isomerase [Porphyromonas macacae]